MSIHVPCPVQAIQTSKHTGPLASLWGAAQGDQLFGEIPQRGEFPIAGHKLMVSFAFFTMQKMPGSALFRWVQIGSNHLFFLKVFLWFLLFNVRCQVDAVEFLNLFHALTCCFFSCVFSYPYALNSKRQKCRLADYFFCPFQQHTVISCKLHI